MTKALSRIQRIEDESFSQNNVTKIAILDFYFLTQTLKEALGVIEFYGNRDNYDREGVCEHNGSSTDYKGDWWVDYGFHAKSFLEKLEAE